EPKKNSLISASRLQIPKNHGYQRLGNSPLVDLESDSEDELFLSSKTSPQNINKQLSQQLARDGFQLDETPDDETLDLIPPNEFRQTDYCACCSVM
uniref:Uncharacterized protein n=1 Tax=Ciona savignyi TaxID=51511 RepID=H2Y5V4_CIOSA